MGTYSRGRVRESMRICYSVYVLEGLEMRESAAGDATCSRSSWEARIAVRAACLGKDLSHARPFARPARYARLGFAI